MSSTTKEQAKEIGDLADDARALMEATADASGQKVERARKRLALALERGKASVEDVAEATADKGSDTLQELRDRIAAALNHGKEIYEKVHDDVVDRSKAADHAVRENPYKTMGIALGVGALVGCIISFRHSHKGKGE